MSKTGKKKAAKTGTKLWHEETYRDHKRFVLAGDTTEDIINKLDKKDVSGNLLGKFSENSINAKRYELAIKLIGDNKDPDRIAIVSAATRVPIHILTQDNEKGKVGDFKTEDIHTPLPEGFEGTSVQNLPEDLDFLDEDAVANAKVTDDNIIDELVENDDFSVPNKPSPKPVAPIIKPKPTVITNTDPAYNFLTEPPPKPAVFVAPKIIPLEVPKTQIIEPSVIQRALPVHDSEALKSLRNIEQSLCDIKQLMINLVEIMSIKK